MSQGETTARAPSIEPANGGAPEGSGELVPKRVVLAIVTQVALAGIDCASLLFVGFAVLGFTQSTAGPDDPSVDLAMRSLVVGYGISAALGLGLGVLASAGLYRGASWARSAAIAHGVAAFISCCPCNWAMALLAMAAAMHPHVRDWPALPARDLADTFR